MNHRPQFPNPLQPLSVKRIITGALRLYRDRFKAYFSLSLQASLWTLFPYIILLSLITIVTIIFTVLGFLWENDLKYYAWIGGFLITLLVFCLWLLFAIYCWCHSLKNAALLSRFAFKEIIYQPEPIQEVQKNLRKFWSFYGLQVVISLIISGISLLLSMVQWLFVELPTYLINQPFISDLLGLIGNLLYLIIYVWCYLHFFIAETIFVIEDDLGMINSIKKSWQLTNSYIWPIVLIVFCAFLVTIPVYFIAAIPILSVIPLFNINETTDLTIYGIIALGFLGSMLLFWLLNIVALPFWQIVKGIIYYALTINENPENAN